MRKLPRGQWVEFGFWLLFTGIAFGMTFGFDRKVEMYKFGAAGWPRVVIAIVFLAALGQLLQSLFKKDEPSSSDGPQSEAVAAISEESHERLSIGMWILLIIPIIYAALMENLGFYFVTPFFLIAYLYLTGERRLKWLISIPLGIYLFLTVLFTKFLFVGLPTGNLPGFYGLGTWVVEILQ